MAEFRNRQKKTNADLENLENQADDEKKVAKAPPRSALIIVAQVVGVVLGLFLLYIFIVPSPISPVPMTKDEPLPYFDGVMTPNDDLQKISRIGSDKLPGPESLQMDYYGNMYTGLKDGRVVKIEKSGNIVELVRTGENLPNCGDISVEDKCGRPLGLSLDKTEENLYICDSYKGLLQLSLRTNTLTTLIPASQGVNNVPFKFLNSVVASTDGMLYFTDSSWKWSRRDFPYLFLEGGGQGRLISYDLKTKETAVLLDGLFFSNGVAMSPEEDFVIIAESTHARIVRVWTKGDRKGIYDIFADNLPGFPDNVRNAKGGGYWVAFASKREWPFNFLDSIGPYPKVKSLLAKILPKDSFESLVKTYGLVVKLDFYGDIVKSYHDTAGSQISHISEAFEDQKEGVLYLGSFKNNFLGKLKLDESDE